VEPMLDGGFSATTAAAIFLDCNILASGFSKVSYEFFPWESNWVAHELARNCFPTFNSCIWDDDPPSFILTSLINDVSSHELARNYFQTFNSCIWDDDLPSFILTSLINDVSLVGME
jgi:hypothetical protein